MNTSSYMTEERREAILERTKFSVKRWLCPVDSMGLLARPLLLANGAIMSVQASPYHHSELIKGDTWLTGYWLYDSFEVTFLRKPRLKGDAKEWFELYAEREGKPVGKRYLKVPAYVILHYLETVGGVVGVLI